jgi:hypothetical protein
MTVIKRNLRPQTGTTYPPQLNKQVHLPFKFIGLDDVGIGASARSQFVVEKMKKLRGVDVVFLRN